MPSVTTAQRATLVLALALTLPAHAQTLSWTVPTAANANTGNDSNTVTATEFSVASDVDATHLGWYDDTFASPDGLSGSHVVALWDASTQQIIASVTVAAGTAAPKVDRFRMAELPSAVRLTAGRTYIVGGIAGTDPTQNTTIASGSLVPASGFTPTRWLASFASTLVFPTFEFSNTTIRVGAVVGFGAASQPLVGDPSWSVPQSNSSTSGSPTVTGIEFSVRLPTDVTGLGYYDDTFSSSAGLGVSHAVGVYDIQSQQLLVSATVPAGSASPLLGRHRYVPCSRTRLVPGRRYVVAAVDEVDPRNVFMPADFSRYPALTMHAWRVGFPGPLSFPDAVLNTTNFPVAGSMLLSARCPTDYDASGSTNAMDIFEFLNAWFAQLPAGDYDGNGLAQASDIFEFLNAWFAGC